MLSFVKIKKCINTLAGALFVYLFATGCANIVPPQGGPKDETPPQLVKEKSTLNFQTNFQKQRIELTFDEWVQIQDAFNQVVISPPLQYPYELTLKGKTARFDFSTKEELRPDATYTINFGEAIKDLTERNPADNLRFVFSTGPFIDSLQLKGTIVDARTAEPVKGALFMLYDNLSDTVVRTERPFYFARADEKGQFQIDNIKAGTFKGFALADGDLNYLFNQPSEKIGFPDDFIVMNDSTPSVTIRLFDNKQPITLLDDNAKQYGVLKLTFNQPPANLALTYSDIGQKVVYEYDRDTLKVWYDSPSDQRWEFYVRQDTFLNDTAKVAALDRAKFLSGARLSDLNKAPNIRLNPSQPLQFNFNYPLAGFDPALIHLYEDTIRKEVTPVMEIDSAVQRKLTLTFPWKEGVPYELQFLPGALTDLYGLHNDTITKKLQVAQRKDFGTIRLVADSLEAGVYLVLRLTGQDGSLVKEIQTLGRTAFTQTIPALNPSQYNLEVITDWNKNGRWDSGDYDAHLQPEPIEINKLEPLRANWDLEVRVQPPAKK